MASPKAAQSGVATALTQRTKPRTQKITTFLWFNKNAEEAVNFYVSVFKNSKILGSIPYGEAGPGPKGSIMVIDFELDGQEFTALNGGPDFKFNEAMSLVVHCKTQQEVDYFWDKLGEGGEIIDCGWLKDQYGVVWQIVPDVLLDLIQDKDQQKSQRVMKAMMTMKKFDINKLQQAAAGK